MLATVTGTIYRNRGATATEEPWANGIVTFEPKHLDETASIADSRRPVRVNPDTAGQFSVNLWPGEWRVTLPDNEGFSFTVAADNTYDLHDLRGYVPPPGVIVQTVALINEGLGLYRIA